MQIESKIRNIKGKTSYLNQRPRRTKSTCASSPFDSAKVVRNTETAKRNLEKLAEKYKGINNVEGFLNDLWLALGLHNQGGNKKGGKPSRYALYQLQDGTKLSISIRASAHNANANKYVEHPPVPDINLSIVLQKKMRKNQFKSNPSVNIGEYVYVNQKIQNVESPLSQIANSLIGFLSNGEYNDTTGVAIVHGNIQTPQEVVNNQTLNCNRNMNKKLIRLTENDLHKIVKESVKRILRESNIPRYEQPVFIGCSSPNDADVSVEIGFNDYASSLFYVGECGTDGYAALEAVVEYLIQNGIIDHYTADEELVSEYPDDYVEVNGYYFGSSDIVIHQLVGNHGERRH